MIKDQIPNNLLLFIAGSGQWTVNCRLFFQAGKDSLNQEKTKLNYFEFCVVEAGL